MNVDCVVHVLYLYAKKMKKGILKVKKQDARRTPFYISFLLSLAKQIASTCIVWGVTWHLTAGGGGGNLEIVLLRQPRRVVPKRRSNSAVLLPFCSRLVFNRVWLDLSWEMHRCKHLLLICLKHDYMGNLVVSIFLYDLPHIHLPLLLLGLSKINNECTFDPKAGRGSYCFHCDSFWSFGASSKLL